MNAMQISQYADGLLNSHGDKAEAEAAQRARDCEEQGKAAEAESWRAVQTAIRTKRGALQS